MPKYKANKISLGHKTSEIAIPSFNNSSAGVGIITGNENPFITSTGDHILGGRSLGSSQFLDDTFDDSDTYGVVFL